MLEWNGIIFSSFQIAPAVTANVQLCKNSIPFVNIRRSSTRHNGNDTVSRCIFMPLEEDDRVHIETNGILWSSLDQLQTSFMGFQYKPVQGEMVGPENVVSVYLFKRYFLFHFDRVGVKNRQNKIWPYLATAFTVVLYYIFSLLGQ